MSSRGRAAGASEESHSTAAADPLAMAGLRVEMRNGLGSFLVNALERRAKAVPAMWRGGAPIGGLHGADLVFDELSLGRKEADFASSGGAHQLFVIMPLKSNVSQLLGLTNVVGGDASLATNGIEDSRLQNKEEGSRVDLALEDLLFNLSSCMSHMPSNVDPQSYCASLMQDTMRILEDVDAVEILDDKRKVLDVAAASQGSVNIVSGKEISLFDQGFPPLEAGDSVSSV